MPQFIPYQRQGAGDPPWPTLRLELRLGEGPPTDYELRQESVLIGTVAGCDVRLPGGELPPLLCILTHQPQGLQLRSLTANCPILLNDALAGSATVRPNDLLTIGKFRLRVQLLQGRLPSSLLRSVTPTVEQMPESFQELAAARKAFEEERRDWEEDSVRQAEAMAVRSRQLMENERELAALRSTLERQQVQWQADQGDFVARSQQFREQQQSLETERQQIAATRQELAEMRDRLYEQYRKRRDGLVAMQEAVKRAAHNVQEQRRQYAAERAVMTAQGEGVEEEKKALADAQAKLAEEQKTLTEQYRLVEEWQQELDAEHHQRSQAVTQEQERLAKQAESLAQRETQHKEDLARLERFHATLQARKMELDARQEELRRTTDELMVQTEVCTNWQQKLKAQEEKLAQDTAALTAAQTALNERLTQAEQQQQEAVAKWSQCEQFQTELRERELQYAQARLRLDQMEESLRQGSLRLQEEREKLRQERETWEQDRHARDAHMTEMAAVVERFRTLQSSLETAEAGWHQQRLDAEERMVELSQSSFLLQQRAERLQQFRRKLLRQRRGLSAQSNHLLQSEQTREGLQEQLRRRSEALAEREKQVAVRLQEQEQQAAALRQQLQALEEQRTTWESSTVQARADLEARQQALAQQQAQFQQQQQESSLQQEVFLTARNAWEAEKAQLAEVEKERHRRWQEITAQAQSLQGAIPALVQQARTAIGQLGTARQQLREHLREVHAYVQKCQASFEQALQEQARMAEEVRRQQQALVRQQDEHRLEVSQFRQSLADWQAQLAEVQQAWQDNQATLAQREEELTQKRQWLEQSASQIELRLEQLEGQERDVAQRRDVLNRQLHDMQDWYRRKMRELAERKLLHPVNEADDEDNLPAVLSIYASLPDRDRHLVDLLTRMELVDPDTLSALLDEARRRKCSLRDALVDGEYLTPYQMELIETEKLEALVHGPLRIIDRLRAGTWETIYRVFDPRHGSEALLRQLAAQASPEQREEYRQRFTKACGVRHPHVAATMEVLEMNGTPAVVQEWVDGLPSLELADLAATPAAWLRLMNQAAESLHAIHAAGLTHGRLHAGRMLLTAQGELKVCGLGEPGWLLTDPGTVPPAETDDLQALGKIGDTWLTLGGKHRLHRPELKPLVATVQGLLRSHRSPPFDTAASLTAHLSELRQQLADDSVAWQRILAIVQERLRPAEEMPKRQSA